jgi:hypothetical protein
VLNTIASRRTLQARRLPKRTIVFGAWRPGEAPVIYSGLAAMLSISPLAIASLASKVTPSAIHSNTT